MKSDSLVPVCVACAAALLITAFLTPIAAQSREKPWLSASDSLNNADSTRPSYELGEVTVTATRSEMLVSSAPSAVTVIPESQIEAMPGGLVGDAINGTTGLFLRSYGGLGALQTVSIRGMSSEHTLVLVDGQRYNSLQNGQSDFGILSSSNVERIEILKGGYSAMYGADAVGGVINILTRRPTDALSLSLLSSLGSNGYSGQEVGASGSVKAFKWSGMLHRERGTGDYEFERNEPGITQSYRRAGDDFTMLTGDSRLEYAFMDNVRATLGVIYSSADRGTPGPFTDPQFVDRARLSDKIARTQLGVEWELSSAVTTKINSSFQYADERFVDPQWSTNSFSTNRAFFVTPEVRIALSPAFSGTAGFEIGRGWDVSSDLNDANRWQRSLFVTTQHAFSFPFKVPFEMLIYPSVRYDRFSDVDGDISPRLGINLGLLKDPDIRIRSSYGKSFRAPSFNDLYASFGGNPLLKPERSLSFDCGAMSTIPFLGALHLDVSYFSIVTSDRIVWSPGAGGMWYPQNLSKVKSNGVEGQARWVGWNGLVTIALNSTWTDVTKQSSDFPGDPATGKRLIYLPSHTANASVMFVNGKFSLLIQDSWTGLRYTTESNDQSLPAFSTVSAAAKYSVDFGLLRGSVKLEGLNLFDTSYEIIADYPMPLRELRVSFGVEL